MSDCNWGEIDDPWDELGLQCCSYNSVIDAQVIWVLRGIRDKMYSDDIAQKYDMSPEHVELLQSIFASKNITEYGVSPRGCWFDHNLNADEYIGKWESYYRFTWEEEPPAAPSP